MDINSKINVPYVDKHNKPKSVIDSYKKRKGFKIENEKRKYRKKRRDLTMTRFGNLVVKEMLFDQFVSGHKRTMCRCVCDCGNEVTVRSDILLAGKSTSCGCMTIERRAEKNRKDLTGKKFGRLTVIEMIYDKKQDGGTKCKCKCDCGNIITVLQRSLTYGSTVSCGCYQKERTIEVGTKDWTGVVSPYGVKFLKKSCRDANRSWLWECECGICGNIFISRPRSVMSGHTVSCGCVRASSGEQFLRKFFDDNNIHYLTEYTFYGCKLKRVLPFDFAVFNENSDLLFVIEYDGEQHYRPVEFFGGEKEFERRKLADSIKDQYCEENDIDLVRIPYYFSNDDIELVLTNILNKHCISVTTAGRTW